MSAIVQAMDTLGMLNVAKAFGQMAEKTAEAENKHQQGQKVKYLVKHEGPNRHERRKEAALARRKVKA